MAIYQHLRKEVKKNMTRFEFIRDFAFNLKILMNERCMSQADLSYASKIDKGTISRYVQGDIMPTLKNVINIAVALRCDINDLINTDERLE